MLPAACEIPDPDFPVGAARSDSIPVGVERHADHLALMPFQDPGRSVSGPARFQMRTVASEPAEASFEPSGLKATPNTAPS